MFDLIHTIIDDLRFYAGSSFKNKIWVFLFNDNYKLLRSHRIIYFLQKTKFRFLNRYLTYRQHIKYGCHISVDAQIGKRFRVTHAFGIVIGPAIIEDDVTIFQHVTIGSHGNPKLKKSYPTIKSGVKLFTGSTIIGNVSVGNNAVIGAYIIVNSNVPNSVIIPANSVSFNK